MNNETGKDYGDYYRDAAKQAQGYPSVPNEAIRSPTADLEEARNQADQLHGMIDTLEARLFPPQLKAVEPPDVEGQVARREPLAVTARALRQRLDSAASRLSNILDRL